MLGLSYASFFTEVFKHLDTSLTIEEKPRRAEAKVRYLEKENEPLKEFDGIERSVANRPSKKYRLIHSLIEAKGQGFTVVYLCEVAGVSCSGYYKWLSCALKRAQKEQADFEQHLLIKDIFIRKHRKSGWRVIKMVLERQSVVMNHKKIRRLMSKFGLITQIRRMNPYKKMAKTSQEHRTLPNVHGTILRNGVNGEVCVGGTGERAALTSAYPHLKMFVDR